MSGREWKPGDVALVTCSDGKERRAICGRRAVDDGRVWLFRDGTRRDAEDSHARPLVVIDPEDREQVERLRDLMDAAWDEQNSDHGFIPIAQGKGARGNALQAALREFANPTPPRPEEPTGLGAVVEDAEGRRWVRKGNSSHGEDWTRQIGDAWTGGSWDRIAAVRVLSSGVQP